MRPRSRPPASSPTRCAFPCYIAALRQWSTAWLTAIARRKAIDRLRRDQTYARKQAALQALADLKAAQSLAPAPTGDSGYRPLRRTSMTTPNTRGAITARAMTVATAITNILGPAIAMSQSSLR